MKQRVTSNHIERLQPNEIFVFGSNLSGHHGGGAALLAMNKWGAIWGQGVGLQGQTYGIPTMQGGVETIRPYVDEFIQFANKHPEMTFLVTEIGCGIAGFTPQEIAPLFAKATTTENIHLPQRFWDLLERTPVGVGDEIQLTDAIDMLIEKEIVEAFHMTGRSFDCGDKIGYMEAFVEYGLRHDKLGKEFKAFLKDLAKTL